MKVVVIGGTGLIGSKVVSRLKQQGHEAVAASPNTGVNTLTGEGLDAAIEGASVVVDVANSPSFEAKAVMDFFTDIDGKRSGGREESRGGALRRAVGRRHRAPPVQRLLPRQNRAGEANHRLRDRRTRSCTRPSSSSSSTRSPRLQPTATPSTSRPCCSSRWPPMTSPTWSPKSRSPSRSTAASRSPDPSGTASTNSSATFSATRATRARSSPTRKRPTSVPSSSQDSLVPRENPRLGQRHLRDWLAAA